MAFRRVRSIPFALSVGLPFIGQKPISPQYILSIFGVVLLICSDSVENHLISHNQILSYQGKTYTFHSA